MKTHTLYFKNTVTGVISTKVLTYVGKIGKCCSVWKAEDNTHYTNGISGWINVDKYIGN